MATKCVFIYARISEDRAGRAEGVDAQERWGRAYAAEHWPGVAVKVFCDNDLSAAKDDVHRPAFEKMRDGIRRGECAYLWAVEQNRLTRREPEWFSLAGDLVKADVNEVHTKRNGVIDVGGVVAGIMAVLGAYEVKQLRKRVTDKMAELAIQGRPAGGSIFGYRKRIYTAEEQRRLDAWQNDFYMARYQGEDMRRWKEENPRPIGGRRVLDEQGRASMEIVPEQAAALRQAADWILDGWSVCEVAREMRSRGIKGVNGGRVTGGGVRHWLTNPTVAALRVHRGEIIGNASWQPILDEATWRVVCAALETTEQRQPRSKPRQFLLTRLAVCAACELPIFGHWHRSNHKTRHKNARHNYVCGSTEGRGCGASVAGNALERLVVENLFDHLAALDIASSADEHADRSKEIVIELRALDANRTEWLRARDAGQLDLGEYLAAKAKFDEQEKRLNVELAALPAPIQRVDPAELRESWPELPLHRRRRILEDYVEKVVISPRPLRLTLRDVAKASGFSVAAVFSAFNQSPERRSLVSPKSLDKILAAAEEIGYQYQRNVNTTLDPSRVEIFWH